jgi:hypothetical protein
MNESINHAECRSLQYQSTAPTPANTIQQCTFVTLQLPNPLAENEIRNPFPTIGKIEKNSSPLQNGWGLTGAGEWDTESSNVRTSCATPLSHVLVCNATAQLLDLQAA